DGHLGGGGRPRFTGGRPGGRLADQRRQELADSRVPLGVAVRAGRPVCRGDAVPPPGPGRPGQSGPPPQSRRRKQATVTPAPSTDLALWVENLTVSFDGFKALHDVTMHLDRGELRCLIGPNGAGKTTLMDVSTGKTRPDTGGVFLESRLNDLTELSECRIAEMGVGRKFQRPTVFQGHTVYENCELAL